MNFFSIVLLHQVIEPAPCVCILATISRVASTTVKKSGGRAGAVPEHLDLFHRDESGAYHASIAGLDSPI
jgi:hypothetical protein